MAMENGIEGDLSTCDVDHEEGSQQSNINISDVIEVIQTTDPSFEAAVQNCGGEMFSGGGAIPGSGSLQQAPLQQPTAHQHQRRRNAYVQIVEEPASKALRFRYECEGRSAGSIPGVHSTPENKTYPTIEIVGYKGRAVVVVSCVTKDKPYRPHPHNLVGKDGCKKGVCTVEINSDSMCVSFSNLGIQCVKKKDIEDALRVREEIRVDPYKTGYGHRNQPTSIDLNAVRLCFQVFLEGPEKGRFTLPLTPIVSDTIYDKKAMSELVICKMSHCSAPVAGGREVILLCEKVAKEDITIKFYEEVDGKTVWEGYGDFQHANVHKQVAIAFRTPRYRTLDVEQPVKVNIQLRRPTDGATSDPLPFELLPLDSDPVVLKRKRQKYSGEPDVLLRNLQPPAQDIASMDPLAQLHSHGHGPMYQQLFEMSPEQSIKMEPRDQTPSPYGGVSLPQFGGMYRTMQDSPSPQHHATPSPPLDYAGGSCWPPPAILPPIVPSAGMPGPPPDHTTLSSLLDMDSHQLTQLSTNDVSLSTLLEGTLSNSYQMPQRADSLNRMNVEQENMTDSLSRLTTNALNQHFTGAEDLPEQPYGRQ